MRLSPKISILRLCHVFFLLLVHTYINLFIFNQLLIFCLSFFLHMSSSWHLGVCTELLSVLLNN